MVSETSETSEIVTEMASKISETPETPEIVQESIKEKRTGGDKRLRETRERFALASKKLRLAMDEAARHETRLFKRTGDGLSMNDLIWTMGRYERLEDVRPVLGSFNWNYEKMKPFYFLIEKAAKDTRISVEIMAFTCYLLSQYKKEDSSMNNVIQAFILHLRNDYCIMFDTDAIIAMFNFSALAKLQISNPVWYAFRFFAKNYNTKFLAHSSEGFEPLEDFGALESYLFLFETPQMMFAHFNQFCQKIDPACDS